MIYKEYLIVIVILLLNGIQSEKTISVLGSTTSDIQDVIDQASPGDTVLIPAGVYKYTEKIKISTPNLIIKGVGVDPSNPRSGTYLEGIQGNPEGYNGYKHYIMDIEADNVRVTGIAFCGHPLPSPGTSGDVNFMRYWASNAIFIEKAENLRIDHNYFTSFGFNAIESYYTVNNNLLVDHNWFIDNYLEGAGYGINVGSSKIFIENNYFEDNRHDIAAGNGGYYIARYNYFYSTEAVSSNSNIDAHYGTSKVEIYKNIVKHEDPDNLGSSVLMRGVEKEAMIFENTFENVDVGIRFKYYDNDMPDDKYWIWKNTYINVNHEIDQEGGGDFDIYRSAPVDYTSDQYPHPLNNDLSHPGPNGIFTKSPFSPSALKVSNLTDLNSQLRNFSTYNIFGKFSWIGSLFKLIFFCNFLKFSNNL